MIKRLLLTTTLLLMSVSALVAQNFEFRYHGESLADGAMVTIEAEENDFGEIACETNPSSNPNNGLVLQILSGNYTQGTATMTILENTFVCDNINWCMGGLCSQFGSNTSLTKIFSINNGLCQAQFDALDIQSDGYLVAVLTATIDGITRTVNIKFINGEQADNANFEFRYHGNSLSDGSTVKIVAEENDFGEIACETNPSSNPNNGLILQMLSGNYTQGAAIMTSLEKTFVCDNVNWCMGGLCSSFGSNTSLTKMFSANNGICLVQFDALDIQSDGHMNAILTASIGGVVRTVKIKFTYGEQEEPVPGDVNGDGVVTASDVTAIYNYLLNDDTSLLINGDQNGDGNITSSDVTAIYNILLGN
ncbi:MAG: dockerin type I repeat-containing protein [Muribaculaceae bacterium]|nr:dockerin type I repeat-containing protein [Muribaculaceae bacterium]